MNAASPTRKCLSVKKFLGLLLVGALAYIEFAKPLEPFFNDVNYDNLCHDLDATIALTDGSPEQAVAYMKLGKHLTTPIYGKLTGYDVVHWVRNPNNPIRPLLRWHPQLTKDWDLKDADGLSNADHYRGFTAGPVSGARILFQESAPEHLDRLNEMLEEYAGTDPETLDLAGQEELLQKALVDDPEGRRMIADLTSRRLLGAQARGYRILADVAGIPGRALRWTQRNCLWLVGGFIALHRSMRNLRQWRHAAKRAAEQST
jgi:hypothetical protein